MRGHEGGPGGPIDPMVDESNGGGGGGNLMDGNDLYGMYGVPHHTARLSPGPFGPFPTNPHYNNRQGPPDLYEFEYEEPHHFT